MANSLYWQILVVLLRKGKKMEQVQDVVARYRKDLEKPEHIFNIWAFIFNSFYWLFGGAPLSGLLLFFGQGFLLANFADDRITVAAILMSVRLLNGFFGEQYLRRMKAKYIAENKDADTLRKVNFVYVPLWRIIVFFVLSLGFYNIFWQYMQWKAFKHDTKYKIVPLGRAIFGGLFIWPLIYRLKKNAPQPEKVPDTFWFTAYAAAAALCLSYGLPEAFWLIGIGFWFFALAGFLFIQHTINKQVPHEYNGVRMIIGELACIAVMLVFLAISFTTAYKKAADQYADDRAVAAANIGYFGMIGVRQKCIEYGYKEMKSPQIFADKYADSLDALDRTMRNRLNISLPQYWGSIDFAAADTQMAIGDILNDKLKDLPEVPQDETEAMRAACAAIDKEYTEKFQSEEFDYFWQLLLQEAKVK